MLEFLFGLNVICSTSLFPYTIWIDILYFLATRNSELRPRKGCDLSPRGYGDCLTLPVTGIYFVIFDFWVNGCLYFHSLWNGAD